MYLAYKVYHNKYMKSIVGSDFMMPVIVIAKRSKLKWCSRGSPGSAMDTLASFIPSPLPQAAACSNTVAFLYGKNGTAASGREGAVPL